VADDVVVITKRGADVLIANGLEAQRHYMEIRGVGLIDIPTLFGVRAVRQQKRIEVVVHLAEWNEADAVDRTGLDGEKTEILGVSLPRITVPLNPGKNITVVSEVIAMNHLLLYSGVQPAEQFNQRLIGRMRAKSDVRRYLLEDHE
jgi:HPr kinase/phosphorylase